MHDPREEHLQTVYGVLQYLKTTPERGLLFKKGGVLTLEIFLVTEDAGSPVDKRYTTGYFVFLRGKFVTQRSTKQLVIARSIVEVEFKAIAHGLCEVLWIDIILDDLRIKRKWAH